MNKTILIVAVAFIAVVGAYSLLKGNSPTQTQTQTQISNLTPTPTPETTVKEITVIGKEFSFSPASITLKAGEKIKLTFQNNGGYPHNLVIEGLGISTKTIASGKTDVIEFTAPGLGTYNIFCSVPGHKEAGMKGQLTAE